MLENRPHLKAFIEANKKQKTPKISPDTIDEFSPVLPDAFIITWQNIGFDYCAYNTIQFVNPADYTDILFDFDFNSLDFFIVAITAIGDLIIWNAPKYALYRYSIHDMTCEKIAGSADIDHWFGMLANQRYRVIDFLKLKDIDDNLCRQMLLPGKIITYMPPLMLDGDRDCTSIQDVTEYYSDFCSDYKRDHAIRFKDISAQDGAQQKPDNFITQANEKAAQERAAKDSPFETIGANPFETIGQNQPVQNTYQPPVPNAYQQPIQPAARIPSTTSELAKLIATRLRDHRFVPAVRLDSVNRKHAILDHKIGGPYYIPNINKIPKNLQTGGELFLLAQINFAQIQKIPDFPTDGLLQIFMDPDPHTFRQFAHPTQQISWRVRFIPQTPSYAELSNLTQHMPETPSGITTLPFDTMRTLPLVPQDMMQDTPLEDFPIESMIMRYCGDLMPQDANSPQAASFNDAKRQAIDIIRREFRPGRMNDTLIQIGGNPTFYRPDPRPVDPRVPGVRTPNVLLLQLPCFDGFNWGDSKDIVHFFISRKDLRERNFNNVLMDMTF